MRVVECQSLVKVSRLSGSSWLLDTPCNNYLWWLFAKYQAPLYIQGELTVCKQMSYFLFQTLGNKTYTRNERASIAQLQTKIKWSLFWVSIINRTVPPLKKKKGKKWKVYPKMLGVFWILNLEFFENFRQQADSLKFG